LQNNRAPDSLLRDATSLQRQKRTKKAPSSDALGRMTEVSSYDRERRARASRTAGRGPLKNCGGVPGQRAPKTNTLHIRVSRGKTSEGRGTDEKGREQNQIEDGSAVHAPFREDRAGLLRGRGEKRDRIGGGRRKSAGAKPPLFRLSLCGHRYRRVPETSIKSPDEGKATFDLGRTERHFSHLEKKRGLGTIRLPPILFYLP